MTVLVASDSCSAMVQPRVCCGVLLLPVSIVASGCWLFLSEIFFLCCCRKVHGYFRVYSRQCRRVEVRKGKGGEGGSGWGWIEEVVGEGYTRGCNCG